MLNQLALVGVDVHAKLRNRVSLQIIAVSDARYMLEKFHYLHRTRAGRQINYAVLIDGRVDGVITYAYPMISSPIRGVEPDCILEFGRLYLHSNIPNTATCAIGKSLKRIKHDWEILYPDAKPITLIVSWSDVTLHAGTIYKAANFKHINRRKGKVHGATSNNKRGARPSYDDYKHEKDCWVYEL